MKGKDTGVSVATDAYGITRPLRSSSEGGGVKGQQTSPSFPRLGARRGQTETEGREVLFHGRRERNHKCDWATIAVIFKLLKLKTS